MKQLEGSRLEPIPHPPRWPLLGNLLDVMRKPTFIESLTALSDGYETPRS